LAVVDVFLIEKKCVTSNETLNPFPIIPNIISLSQNFKEFLVVFSILQIAMPPY
jgi:hypothetical protein